MIRSPNTEDEALSDGESAYFLGSDGVAPHEIPVICGEAYLPRRRRTSKAVDAARLISKAVHNITDDD